MNRKKAFLAIETYEEFDKRREEFKGLTLKDPEVREHLSDIFPKVSSTKEELYSYLPDGRRVLGGNGGTKKPDNRK